MKRFNVFVILLFFIGTIQAVYPEENNLDMELEVSDEEKIILFGGFAFAVIALFLFLARDIILRKKTSYDKEELESKKEKTYEKYHSDWGDDYEEIGTRKNSKEEKEFRDAAISDDLPNYYAILGLTEKATQEEIKNKFRELAKKTHPDKTKEDSEEKMALLNKAYEILSDKKNREKYDKYLKID
ncbi:MAG: J domain-containing protein [Nitrosopumilus sp.]